MEEDKNVLAETDGGGYKENDMSAPYKIENERRKVEDIFANAGTKNSFYNNYEDNKQSAKNDKIEVEEKKVIVKKSSNGFLIAILLILIIAFGVACFYAYEYFKNYKKQVISKDTFNSRIVELENGETWVKYDEKKVNLEIFYSESCGDKCSTEEVVSFLQSKIPTLEIKKTDIDKTENKDLKYVPVFVFDESITKTNFYNQAKDLFVEKNGKYFFDSVGIGFPVGKQLAGLSDEGFVVGDENAKLKIVVVTDFGCDKCAIAHPIFKKLETEYKGKVKFVYKIVTNFEDDKIKKVSLASFCANEQKGFDAFADIVFSRQKNWMEVEKIEPVLETYAINSKINKVDFIECLKENKAEEEMQKINKEIEEFGISGVPVYFINEEKLEGVPTYEEFKVLIDKALGVSISTNSNSTTSTSEVD